MRQHHTKIHGRPLPNRTCEGCGTKFYDPKARRSYRDRCDPNAGEHNGNWKGAKESTTCERCGDDFECYPSEKQGIYCPSCVENGAELSKLGPERSGERAIVSCEQCRADVRILQSRYEREGTRFCSPDCHHEWMAVNRRGPDHHQWDGGQLDYGEGWWQARRRALARDDHSCQCCGTTADELGQEPDVHHVERVRDFGDPTEAHTLDNLIVLCRSCHRLVEAGRVPVPVPSNGND